MTTLRLILLCIAMILSIAAVYAGSAAVALVAVWIMDGGVALLWTAAGVGIGLWVLRLMGLDPRGSLRFASAGGLGLGLLGLLVLALGLAGWLSRPTVALLAAGGLCGWIPLLRGLDRTVILALLQKRPAGWVIWLVPALMLGLGLVAVAVPPGILWNRLGDPQAYDVLEYHLQVPREWYELGRIVGLKHNAFSYFPFAMEMHFLAMMHLMGGPWAGMYASQFIVLVHMVLAVMAVHGAAAAVLDDGEASNPKRSAIGPAVSAAVMAGVPWTLLLGTIAYNEAGLILYVALAIAWTVRQDKFSWPAWLIGGAFAGLACGCKYTGAPMLLALWPAALLLAGKRQAQAGDSADSGGPQSSAAAVAGRPFRPCGSNSSLWLAQRLKGIVVYFAMGLALFSPWLVRNLIWTGNPVFPEALKSLGRAHFSERQVERWETAHSAAAQQKPIPARLKAFQREVIADGRYGYALWPVVIGAAVCLRRHRQARAMAIFIVLLAVFWLSITHLQSRFFVAAVVPAAIMVGVVFANRIGRWWAVGTVALLPWFVVALIHSALWPAAQLQAFGLGDLSQFDEAIKTRCEAGSKIALIGEARAFLYVMPMARLRYRTVFDVDQRPGQDIVDAWLGSDADLLRRDHQIVVEQSELLRFSRTYRYIEVPASPAGSGASGKP